MSIYLDLTWRYPDLIQILRDATRVTDWNAAARIRARVRALGMSPADVEGGAA